MPRLKGLRGIIPSIGYLGIILIIFLFGLVSVLSSMIVEGRISSTFLTVFGTTMVAISVLSLVYEYFMTERILRSMREAFPYFSDPNKLPHILKIETLYKTLLSLSPTFRERSKLEKKLVRPIVESLETTIRRDMRFNLTIRKDNDFDCTFVHVEGSYRLENTSDGDILWYIPFEWNTARIQGLKKDAHIKIDALVVRIEGEEEQKDLSKAARSIEVYASEDEKNIEPMSLVIPKKDEFMIMIPKGSTARVRFNFQVACRLEDKLMWRMQDFTDRVFLKLSYDPRRFRVLVGEFCLGERESTYVSEGQEEHEWDSYFLPEHGIFLYWYLVDKKYAFEPVKGESL